jgi:GWxTD domain-containing protein
MFGLFHKMDTMDNKSNSITKQEIFKRFDLSPRCGMSILFLAIFGILIISPCCSLFRSMRDDPYFKEFYEKTSIIMTDEERAAYRNLRDSDAKKEFIEQFWRIRDPDPGTEENETWQLFEERIEYANRWFGWRKPPPGSVPDENWDKYIGWDTDRGRVYLVLGEPDLLYFDIWPMYEGRTIAQPEGESSEAWIYYRYQLTVYFTRSSTRDWRLSSQSSKLFQTLNKAKLEMIHPDQRKFIEEPLGVEAKFENDTIRIVVPISGVNWDAAEEVMVAEFGVDIDIFHEDQKIDEVHEKKSWRKTEKELFETYELVIEIPFVPEREGNYRLEIVVEDLMAFTLSQYKTVVRFSK